MQVESALLFETSEEIVARVFRTLRPGVPVPRIQVVFARFASANSVIRLRENILDLRITDMLAEAPAPVLESLFFILLCKLLRKPVPKLYQQLYRLYLNRGDVRSEIQDLRRARGRKLHGGAQGNAYDLDEMFWDLNVRYFSGEIARPGLGWSLRAARTTLGHYDPSHQTIVISKLLDDRRVPRLASEYVLYHEMLHIVHPVRHAGVRRCIHSRDFLADERAFVGLEDAKRILKALPR